MMINLLGTPKWTNEGPNPILVNGSSETGAVQCFAGRGIGSGAYVLYAGAVNGGVWRATNFTSAMLTPGSSIPPAIQWYPLSDQQPSLSVSSLALDPRDTSGNTLWVGTGSQSSTGYAWCGPTDGGDSVGLLKTSNAQTSSPSWKLLGAQLTGQRIVSIIPTMIGQGATQVILVAGNRSTGIDSMGIRRSKDGGNTFQAALVANSTDTLSGYATDLISDPNDPNTFYAALRGTSGGSCLDWTNAMGGVWRTTNGGDSWHRIDAGIPGAHSSVNLQLATFDNRARQAPGSSTLLYVGMSDTTGNANRTNHLIGLYRTTNPRDSNPNWDQLFYQPNGSIPGHPNDSASFIHPYAPMAVNPNDWNVIFLASNSGPLYRIQVSSNPTVWTNIDVRNADHRSLTFLTDDILIITGDQGVFGLQNPTNSQESISLNNFLCVTELYSSAFDPTTGFLAGSAQDVGCSATDRTGAWRQLCGADGAKQIKIGPDGTYFYGNSSGGPATWFRKRNGVIDTPAQLPVGAWIAVSPVTPGRLLIRQDGRLKESLDWGNNAVDVSPPGYQGEAWGLAYGADKADAAYAGTNAGLLFVRAPGVNVFERAASYPGANPGPIAVDLTDWRRAAIIDQHNKVLYTIDGGTYFADITGNAFNALQDQQLRTIEIVTTAAAVVILVGGRPRPGHGGVIRMIIADPTNRNPASGWDECTTGLPFTPISDLRYYASTALPNGSTNGDILVAASLGRGIWTIRKATADIRGMTSAPHAIVYNDGTSTNIYVFVATNTGDLCVRFWNGAWQWANLGKPPNGKRVGGAPFALVSTQRFPNPNVPGELIYVYVRDEDGALRCCHWTRQNWTWDDLACDPPVSVASAISTRIAPGALHAVDDTMEVFVLAGAWHLGRSKVTQSSNWQTQWQIISRPGDPDILDVPGVAYFPGRDWRVVASNVGGGRVWLFTSADSQQQERRDFSWPPILEPIGRPAAITYNDRAYMFFRGKGQYGSLRHIPVWYWDPRNGFDASGQWADLFAIARGTAPATGLASDPAAVEYQGLLYVFYVDDRGELQEVFWDGASWEWWSLQPHMRPPNGRALAHARPSAISYGGAVKNLYVYVIDEDGALWERELDRNSGKWVWGRPHGLPP